ncbi:unnamed protein product [Litomosoides sigmodontis]|uniref:ZP domain-containing protein n=1 Tax=Litomosoides sigmodontis TaxID=42156 RepID=A0A3P6TRG7_LITSI|nr:unnamed protein product [Litomosoides sigmodontis]
MFQILQQTACTPIDNSIPEKPSIQCDSDSITVVFSTSKPFIGRIFVKGYIQDSNCVQVGNQHEQHKFTIKFNQCGLRRSREIFLTKIDRAYRLNCFYLESSKTITQQLEIRWTCIAETEGIYCMRVHTCTVSDGQGGEAVPVLDKKGCSVDKYLLLDLEYTGDLTAGQESHVFKFADRPALHFNCQLELTTKDYYRGCANERPVCKGQVRVEPSEQIYEQLVEEETQTSAYQSNSQQHGYSSPTDTDYKSRQLSAYQNNEMAYLSLPGPPAPPPSRLFDPSRFQSSRRSVYYTADSNYEVKDISTASHSDQYGEAAGQETTALYEDSVIYKRLIRRKRNSTNNPRFSSNSTILLQPKLRVTNVDLPEQHIMVFDLEDESRLTMLLAAGMLALAIVTLALFISLRRGGLFLRDKFNR